MKGFSLETCLRYLLGAGESAYRRPRSETGKLGIRKGEENRKVLTEEALATMEGSTREPLFDLGKGEKGVLV